MDSVHSLENCQRLLKNMYVNIHLSNSDGGETGGVKISPPIIGHIEANWQIFGNGLYEQRYVRKKSDNY